jgi:hypothetical protein
MPARHADPFNLAFPPSLGRQDTPKALAVPAERADMMPSIARLGGGAAATAAAAASPAPGPHAHFSGAEHPHAAGSAAGAGYDAAHAAAGAGESGSGAAGVAPFAGQEFGLAVARLQRQNSHGLASPRQAGGAGPGHAR